ncbi:Protein F15B9.8 [Aphelenchoides avenae]|nr:Protein F15B9.8 [Aphelenchus avenae]
MYALEHAAAGPVNVIVNSDPNSSLHVGPEARAIFELVEEYRPLSQAFNEKNRPKALAALSRPAKHQPVKVLVALPEVVVSEPQQLGRSAAFWPRSRSIRPQDEQERSSQWLEWTSWSGCASGERIRIRQCLEVNDVKCVGKNIESHKCFSFQRSNIPFAKDPLTIEREISMKIEGENESPDEKPSN